MLTFATALLVVGLAFGDTLLASQDGDTTALAVAIGHARTVIPDGAVQVSPDTVASEAKARLEAAARAAGFPFGHDHEAVHCADKGPCRSRGLFRGLVHVVEYQRPNPDALIATLRMLRFTPEADAVYEQVDEVHVARSDPGSLWRIIKVVRISES